MTTNASRAPIDFDAFERDLQSSPQDGETGRSEAPKGDPLAELARIVGQDDPFRALLESRGTLRPAARVEPNFSDADPAPYSHPAAATPADAFDQYLASVEQSHQNAGYQDPAAFESDDQDYQNAAAAAPRSRSRLVQVGAGLGVLVLCVSGAFAWKGLHGGIGGSGPVTVLADKSPLKVAPEKADGVDIPDQNKQIYDRNAKDGQIKVVNREEQPLDVAQAARAASRENGNPGGVTPGGGLLTESLGEPRRIRTVAVKPDTPPPAMQQQHDQLAEAPPEHKAESKSEPRAESKPETRRVAAPPIPTMTMPDGTTDGTTMPPNPSMKSAARAPSANPAAAPATPRPASTTTPVAEASAAEEPVAAPAPTPASRRTLKRVASVAPETTASTTEPDAVASAAPSSTASVGGFAVQLGVRNTEADAHAAFQQMQSKHSQLAGKPELIRQAEVNGKSLYRVRVGPLSKAEATSLCNTLKGAGSQCFVAAN